MSTGWLMSRLMQSLVVLIAIGVCASPAAGAPSSVGRQVATSGEWKASLTFVKSSDGFSYSDLHLTVLDGSRLVLDAPVTTSLQGGGQLQPSTLGFTKGSSVLFRDLNADGSKELLLSLYTGGAHCCSIEQVFDFAASGPRKTEIDFYDSDATLKSLAGHMVFESHDDSFAYQFTDYADSGEPVELWAYDAGRFTDVTREHHQAVSQDATFWWKAYRSQLKSRGDVRGLLAAWAADEALLGHAAKAKQTLLQLAFSGALDKGYGAPKGSTYVRLLWRFLAKHGYLH